MLIRTKYLEEGIAFEICYKHKRVDFPLKLMEDDLARDSDWDSVNILEQVWYQGMLERTSSGNYLLRPEDLFELDEETISGIPITQFKAEIGVSEIGNVGSRNYKLTWYVLVHGKNAGKCVRFGAVAKAGRFDFLLNQEQYRLVLEIEKSAALPSTEERARIQAKCKYLAKKANVKVSNFMESRDFLFADTAEIQIQSEDDAHIKLVPELTGITTDIVDVMPDKIRPIQQVNVPGRRVHVFTSEEAQRKYNQIREIKDINGTDVPRFLENPRAFIPENIIFDEEVFSKRVKGLKIRTSVAVPFIHIEPDSDHSGWFDVDVGIALHENSGEEPDELVEEGEIQNVLDEAAASGQQYIYINNSWVKLDPEALQQFSDALRKQEEILSDDKKISQENVAKLLDIYENINGIEYNENIVKLKSACLTGYSVARSFCGKLKDYQQEGYSFLRAHYATKTGALLADDMGLGKTIQVIALLSYIRDEDKLTPALLVMPNALIENWESELKKFLPAARIIYKHQGQNRYRSKEQIRINDIVLTTYETLARDQVLLGTIKWSCVICDEVQKIKNFKTFAASAVKGMNTKCKVALTGTPVENRLSELWSIADFVQPGLLNSYQHFRNYYEKPIQAGDIQSQDRADELINALSPIFLRRTKEDVLGDALPGKSEERFGLSLNSLQRELYMTIIDEVRSSDENKALGAIQKLIMLCSHPRLVSKEPISGSFSSELEIESPKLLWTVQRLRVIQKTGEKAVIFTGYKAMQAILRQVIFEEFKVDAKIINGEVKGNRLEIIREFGQVAGFNVLILSPRAAGVGLNIVAANHVIHYTREWNPAIENQATDRVYRIGQEKPVTVYYPVMTSSDFISAEERLDELLTRKRALMKNVIVPSDLSIKWQDFEDILHIS